MLLRVSRECVQRWLLGFGVTLKHWILLLVLDEGYLTPLDRRFSSFLFFAERGFEVFLYTLPIIVTNLNHWNRLCVVPLMSLH